MKTDAVVEALGALAQESRLSIYRLLVKRGPEGFNPGEIIMRLAIPAPTLSFHLKQLQRAGLIASRREGRFLHYSANFDHMQRLVGFLTQNCCSLADTSCDSECKPVALPARKRA
jgi:ArsR family transcriptional regulator, arsenate/arsenite/antimonite-responsive transcriptional repressor